MLNSTHYIRKEKRALIKHSLKERISLRGICRVFAVSLTCLQAFAHEVWGKRPKRLRGCKFETVDWDAYKKPLHNLSFRNFNPSETL